MDLSKEYVKATFRRTRNARARIPLYVQLSDYLRHQIQTGVVKPGDKMIGENDLVEALGISRTTVRLALDRLVEEELIVRFRGRGSFIAEPRLKRNINYLYNFTENIKAAGAQPSSKVLRSEVRDAPEKLRQILQLSTSDPKIFLLERLRFADQEPLIVEKTRIPYYLCPGIEKFDFTNASLYSVLQYQYGVIISHAEESIEAVVLDKNACNELGCKPGMPGYSIKRLSFLETGYLCEYTSSMTRGDKCVFKLDLHNSMGMRSGCIDFERQLRVE